LIKKECFKELPPRTYEIVKYERDAFFRRSWEFDDDKEDIENELIFKIWDNHKRINAAENPGAYVRQICQNHFKEILRKKRGRSRIIAESRLEGDENSGGFNMDKFPCPESAPDKDLEIEDLSIEELINHYDKNFSLAFRKAIVTVLVLVSTINQIREFYRENVDLKVNLEILRSLLSFRKKIYSILRPHFLELKKWGEEDSNFKNFYIWASKIYEKTEKEKISEKEALAFYGQVARNKRFSPQKDLPPDCPMYFGSNEEINPVIYGFNYLALLNNLIRICKRKINLSKIPFLDPDYLNLLGIEDYEDFLGIAKLRISPCQIVFDVIKKAPDLRRGGVYSNLKKIKLLIWYLKTRNDPYSQIFDRIKSPADVEKLRQYHYRQKSRPYAKVIKNIYSAAFVQRIALPLYEEEKERVIYEVK